MSDHKLCPCRFQIPLVLNDGSETPENDLVAIFAAMRRQFGGWTVLGQRDGVWEGQAEPSLWIEIAVPIARVPELKELVYSIGKRLKQKAMYFDAPLPTVEIFPIEHGDDEPSEESGSQKEPEDRRAAGEGG
ncbi:MAG: hypothetical protein JSS27_07235 [Planctomycetes bacterium]|nr:hypothetical protein [Planctomycetota bacterium]